MKKWIIANFKMNLLSSEVSSYLHDFLSIKISHEGANIVFCPPFLAISQFSSFVSDKPNYFLGAQNCSEYENGAYTGEISAKMLADIGVQFVIIWHQERRKMSENSIAILAKIQQAIKQNITPIVCLENPENSQNHQTIATFLKKQITEIFEHISTEQHNTILFAYEPAFAIWSGKTPNPKDIDIIFSELKWHYNNHFLYGWSINENTIKDFIKAKNIDGFLVWSACLDVKKFAKIITYI